MIQGSDFEKALNGRPADYDDLPPESQWDIDKSLGILDWNGNCTHGDEMCPACRKIWDEKFHD